MLQGEMHKLLHIEDALRKRVVGQEAAIEAVAQCGATFACGPVR